MPIDLAVESLPLALLYHRTALASLLAVGENPAGRIGSGQELYAVGTIIQTWIPRTYSGRGSHKWRTKGPSPSG